MAILRNTYQTADMRRSGWRFFDYFTLILVIALITLGVLMINSATLNSTDPDLAGAARRQTIYAVVGIAIMLVTATIDYRIWQNARHGLYGAAIVFLLITLVFGTGEIGGVGRWLTFLEAFPVQPAELAKVLMILSLAGFLADRRDEMDQFKNVALSLVYIGIPAGLIFLQPNLSTAVVFIFIWLGMMITTGVKARHLAIIGGLGIAAMPIVWLAMAQYQRDRLLAFLNPDRNPAAKYNLDQALIGIGSGGWLGQGYSTGTQSQLHFLKVRHTDFIFSVTAEELGFVGAVLLLVLFGLLLYRLLRIADKSRDAYGELIVVGVAAMIFFQTVINIAMNLNMGVVAGLPLPMVSYGGSSLITMLLAIGLAQSVIMRHKTIEF